MHAYGEHHNHNFALYDFNISSVFDKVQTSSLVRVVNVVDPLLQRFNNCLIERHSSS